MQTDISLGSQVRRLTWADHLNFGLVRRAIGIVPLVVAVVLVAPGPSLTDLWIAGGSIFVLLPTLFPHWWKGPFRWLPAVSGALLLSVGLANSMSHWNVYTLLVYSLIVNTSVLLSWPEAVASSTLTVILYRLAKEGFLAGDWRPDFSTTLTDLLSGLMLVMLLKGLVHSQAQITELNRRLAKRTLETESDLQRTLEASVDMIVVMTAQAVFQSVSPACRTILGYEPEELIGRHPADLIHRDDLAKLHLEQFASSAGPGTDRFEHRYMRKDGGVVWLEWSVRRPAGEAVIYGVARDISNRKAGEQRLRESEERYRSLFEQNPDMIFSLGPDGNVESINPACAAITGHDAAKLASLSSPELANVLFAGRDAERARWRHHRELARQGISQEFELTISGADGRGVAIDVSCMPIVVGGEQQGVFVVAKDISERKRFEAELAHLASHDPLTGLLNRRRFHEELEEEVALARKGGALAGALLFLDLDEFKFVNDTLGHQAGDELLKSLVGVIQSELEPRHLLSRLSGDEFAIMLRRTDMAAAQAVAIRVLEAFRRSTFMIKGQVVGTTASIGIALFPAHGSTAQELLSHADQAMYQAKAKGRNLVAAYTPESDFAAQVEYRLTVENQIRRALDSDGFLLFAQPIYDIKGCYFSQYELLLRMVGEDGSIVPPAFFLQTAERFGLIHRIDRWVVSKAIHLIRAHALVGRDLCLEVNLSSKALSDPELLAVIRRELDETGIRPERLVLEITETSAIADFQEACAFITTLKALGCRFALDDFGSGFSSFDRLKRLPVDYLKLDGSFIRNLPRSPEDLCLVKAMVEVAVGLGKSTIAEFVEDAETLAILAECGVDHAQGYHLGRPRNVYEIWPDLKQ